MQAICLALERTLAERPRQSFQLLQNAILALPMNKAKASPRSAMTPTDSASLPASLHPNIDNKPLSAFTDQELRSQVLLRKLVAKSSTAAPSVVQKEGLHYWDEWLRQHPPLTPGSVSKDWKMKSKGIETADEFTSVVRENEMWASAHQKLTLFH